MTSSHTYKLYYFNFRGRAEILRLILTQAGQNFEDKRFWNEDWIKYDADPDACQRLEKWTDVQKSQMPFGQLPVLETDGKKLSQSQPIARYLARQFNLIGENELDAYRCDALVDAMQDLRESFSHAWFDIADPKEMKEAQDKLIKEDVPRKFKQFEVLMAEYGNGPWVVGNSVTWCDLMWYDSVTNFIGAKNNLLDDYPRIKKNREVVENLPRIAAYLKTRPYTTF